MATTPRHKHPSIVARIKRDEDNAIELHRRVLAAEQKIVFMAKSYAVLSEALKRTVFVVEQLALSLEAAAPSKRRATAPPRDSVTH